MALNTLHDRLIADLRHPYNARNQIAGTSPRMAKAASTPQLPQAFEEHHRQTQEQIRRLETVFDALATRTRGKPCNGMTNILEEGRERMLMQETDPDMRDAALIEADQRVEHYEIADYGMTLKYYKLLCRNKVNRLLQQTLDEEEQNGATLTDLAERLIHPRAAQH